MVLVVLLGAAAVGVYSYDASHEDLIAEGVTVGGIDVGGLRAAQARVVLDEGLAQPLERPLEVTFGDRRFRLSASRARVSTDVDGLVRDAVAESRKGNAVSRTLRDLSGVEIDADLDPRVRYSRKAVDGLLRRVQRGVDRPAQDARIDFSTTRLRKVRQRDGRAVRTRELEGAVKHELVRPAADRVVAARTRVLKPKVTVGELTAKYPRLLTIDRASKQLRFFRRLKLAKTYTIAVGQAGFESPPGLFRIQNKAINPAWNAPEWAGSQAGQIIPGGAPNNPLKSRWLGVAAGTGIHGTDQVGSLGTAASHGCFRMSIPEVEELYPKVPVGTPIYIA